MEAERPRRKYDSLRRTTQAMETRAEIARAALDLFVAKGWANTTVRDVAKEAGVSVPTVYAAYQNKTGLTRALADAADLSAEPARMLSELERADADPARQLGAMVAFDRRLYERAGDVIALVREAGRTEPELGALYTEGRALADRNRLKIFTDWPAGTLRTGLGPETAVDIYAAMCNIDSYTTLTGERGWPAERIESWWREALPRELLAPRP
ncbi:TetR family transcriptional regulator [Prauserella marina]|uniref:DNA-binding transcriptional regulator, AcrR family n=1 Tax=Prauserella marina TaxID=530584 RepID=A0A222VL69_9PSEU|nr:TetR/AcrR family transcriptional regulator [Prauserella marina]ASR34503.1 TetR family transcriptional regulator [Prauserella marina]PWV85896.1 TetR family transcriptional regulator [Prauserella marina]SDC42884.1 DNA-binding transcriptional regulator, AcrR family [Prauserella marina]